MTSPKTNLPRVIIVGGGFAGLETARKLANKPVEVIVLDRNNYFTFQPLLYQVATAGLEMPSVVYPFRRIFRTSKNIRFRLAEVTKVNSENNTLHTSIGNLTYDYLVLATGTRPAFFGLDPARVMTMKSTQDAQFIRNTILTAFERALDTPENEERDALVNLVIVGGGPTGVELAGAFAEMKNYVLPRDYPDLDMDCMQIHLVEGLDRLLPAMKESSSHAARKYLEEMGVKVTLNTLIKEYDGDSVDIDGQQVPTHNLIWTAGVEANPVEGIEQIKETKGNRLPVDRVNRIVGYHNVFAIGDLAAMQTDEYPQGHPQLAPVAMQQGKHLGKNLINIIGQQQPAPFDYTDKGTLATIGRNKAVAELPFGKFKGFVAWFLWMGIHLMSLVGFRNKVVTFFNWISGYFRYDRALRIIQYQKPRKRTHEREPLEENV